MSEWRDKMFAKLAEQKIEFIDAHINTYGEYPKGYMSDLDIDTIFAMRRMLESRIVKLQSQIDRSEIKSDFTLGQQAGLMYLLEHLDEFVELQVSKAEDQLGEPMSY